MNLRELQSKWIQCRVAPSACDNDLRNTFVSALPQSIHYFYRSASRLGEGPGFHRGDRWRYVRWHII